MFNFKLNVNIGQIYTNLCTGDKNNILATFVQFAHKIKYPTTNISIC